jgi:hypothetical protein
MSFSAAQGGPLTATLVGRGRRGRWALQRPCCWHGPSAPAAASGGRRSLCPGGRSRWRLVSWVSGGLGVVGCGRAGGAAAGEGAGQLDGSDWVLAVSCWDG